MDAPRQNNLHLYIKECKKHGVTDIVRVCEATYSNTGDLTNAGIQLHEMAYDDGTSPPESILVGWLNLVEECFLTSNPKANRTIAVHCVAGLGRAPVLVAIALIEYGRMDPVQAVSLIRKHRRGAINEKQLNYLESYKTRRRGSGATDGGSCCIIS